MTSSGIDLSEYIAAVKHAYRMLRTRYRNGQEFSFRYGDEPRWVETARALAAQGGNPYGYVKFVFERCLLIAGDVFPNQVNSPRMIREYFHCRPERVQRLELLVKLQAESMKVKIGNGWKLEDIFDDPGSELSPIFCFAVAWSEGRKDLAEKLRPAAERVLLFEPEYKRILKAWLPEEMVEEKKS